MNALGDLTTTNTLLASQLGTEAKPINKAYITNLIPPIAADTLQQVCDTGNTTTTDIDMNGGKLTMTTGDIQLGSGDVDVVAGNIMVDVGNIQVNNGIVLTDQVSAIAPNDILTLKTYVKSLKVRYELAAPTLVIPDECQFGNIVQIRSGTASAIFTMPRSVEGGHFTIINASGNPQRIVAPVGETLDGFAPPTFINLSATTPYCVECRVGNVGEWFLGQY
jgi:hypothetical protein